jgi:hypothetical protein
MPLEHHSKSISFHWLIALSALWGTAEFCAFFGLSVLDPWNLSWVLVGDSGQSQIAWMFFSQSQWTFPLGYIDGLVAPLGTTLTFTDGLPLLAIPLKLLLPSALAPHIQFFGAWLWICCVSQVFFAVRLLENWYKPWYQLIPATLLLSSVPVFLGRHHHLALCGQWLLLAVFANVLSPDRKRAERHEILLSLIALLVHPYLAAMAIALTLIPPLVELLYSQGNGKSTLKFVLKQSALCASLMCVLGYFGEKGVTDTTPQFFPTDLLQFLNPLGTSAVLPKLRSHWRSEEAFAYLGLGPLLLGLFWMVFHSRLRRQNPLLSADRRLILLLWPCVAMAVFSLGPEIYFGGNPLLSLAWAYQPVEALFLAFRATGRFIWPLYYFVLLALLIVPRNFFNSPWRTVTLWLLVAVQAGEWGPWWSQARLPNREWNVLSELGKSIATLQPKRIAFIPPFFPLHEKECSLEPSFSCQWYFAAGVYASQRGIPINSGSIARFSEERAMRYCEEQLSDWRNGRFDSQTLYIVNPRASAALLSAVIKHTTCETHHDAWVCRADRATALLAQEP